MIMLIFLYHRVLTDSQTKLGTEYILSAFHFENDKHKALNILGTVSIFCCCLMCNLVNVAFISGGLIAIFIV